jgi:hypothetical protein
VWQPGEPKPVVGSMSGSYRLLLERRPIAVRLQDVHPVARETYPSARIQQLAGEVARGSATKVIGRILA